ncbi:MAG: hypothetical protein KGY74_07105 [Candidatus Cloacimonetes bacterium]|nr:hypothetical protein [Candidatus Cloacimonadota bacterium]
MGKYGLVPETPYGWLSIIAGILGSVMWMTQYIWNWFGITEGDKSLYSLVTLILLIMACAAAFVGNASLGHRLQMPNMTFLKITVFGVSLSIIGILIINGVGMTMDTSYADYAAAEYGYLTGLRQLTAVTSGDVNSLVNFALGIRQLVRALFLIVPGLIATWGGLSVLTADSIDEAEGGILAIVAAMVVFFVVWIRKRTSLTLQKFKAADVALMFM